MRNILQAVEKWGAADGSSLSRSRDRAADPVSFTATSKFRRKMIQLTAVSFPPTGTCLDSPICLKPNK